MTETTFALILPSGRAARIVAPTLEDTFAITEQASSKAGRMATSGKAGTEIAKETVRVCLRAITRAPVPWLHLPSTEATSAVSALRELLAREDADAADVVADALAIAEKAYSPLPAIDVEGMLASVNDGAGGGWVSITYQDLARASGPTSLVGLFNDRKRDFFALEQHINAVDAEESGGARKVPLGALSARVKYTSG